jgi:hypothetical protein
MKPGGSSARPLLLLALVSCTPPPQSARTVELADPNAPEANTGGSPVAAASIEPRSIQSAAGAGAESASGVEIAGENTGVIAAGNSEDDSQFVQSRSPQRPTAEDVKQLPIHLNESWWPFRAKHLGISVTEAKRRDAGISMTHAPRNFWDEQTAVEAVSIWSVLCNECHGGRRTLEDALTMPAPGPAWGQAEGLFFGNRRGYRHVFHIVHNGGPPQNGERSEMIAWHKELSREQIWSLLYFLEYQSGGIIGRFPPSLYPRKSDVLGNR